MQLEECHFEIWHPDFIRTTHARMIFATYADISEQDADILPNMHWTWIERNPKFEELLIKNLVFRDGGWYQEQFADPFEAAQDALDHCDQRIRDDYVERFVDDLYRCYQQLRLTHIITPPALIEPRIVAQLSPKGGGFSWLN